MASPTTSAIAIQWQQKHPTLQNLHSNIADDFLPLLGTDYIELYVGNAKQSAHYYQHAFGFDLVAYSGPETGQRELASYVLQQGKIRLVLTTALSHKSSIAEHVQRHGDGVKVLALWVDDAAKAYEETTQSWRCRCSWTKNIAR